MTISISQNAEQRLPNAVLQPCLALTTENRVPPSINDLLNPAEKYETTIICNIKTEMIFMYEIVKLLRWISL